MIKSIIVAVSENNVIGLKGKIPWKISEDLKYFKRITTGHTVAMGRKTYESIGKPLPNRINIVITRNKNYIAPECVIVDSIEKSILQTTQEDELFFIGGFEIYKKALCFADRIYLTKVLGEFNGDVFFPLFDKNEWNMSSEIESANKDCIFVIMDRKKI